MTTTLRLLLCAATAHALTIPSLTTLTTRFSVAPAVTRLDELHASFSQGAATTAVVGATCLALSLAMPGSVCAYQTADQALTWTNSVAAPNKKAATTKTDTAAVQAELAAIQASRKAAEAELKAAKQVACAGRARTMHTPYGRYTRAMHTQCICAMHIPSRRL